MKAVVGGLEKGDSVYLNDIEFELVSIQIAPPDAVQVVAYTPDQEMRLSGDWNRLRNDLGLKTPHEHND